MKADEFFISLMFILVSLPLIFKKIGPNSGYGFRYKKTLSDEEIWYKANYIFGILMFFTGLIPLIVKIFVNYILKIEYNTIYYFYSIGILLFATCVITYFYTEKL